MPAIKVTCSLDKAYFHFQTVQYADTSVKLCSRLILKIKPIFVRKYILQKEFADKICPFFRNFTTLIFTVLPFLPSTKFTGKTVNRNLGKNGKFFYRERSNLNTLFTYIF